MKKALLMAALAVLPVGAAQVDTIKSWESGAATVTLTLDDTTLTLTVSGNGAMADYGEVNSVPLKWVHAPWRGVSVGGRGRGDIQITRLVIEEGVTRIGNMAFSECRNLTSVTIPNSVTFIGSEAFYWCTGLTSVTIPGGVTSIEKGAFLYCERLAQIKVAADNAHYVSVDSVLFNKNQTALIHYPMPQKGPYIVPDGVTSIEEMAFWNCHGLTSVTIPNSVASIENEAFRDCGGLASVTIGNGVTSIGKYAFYGCWKVKSVTLPKSVAFIGEDAFGCRMSIEIAADSPHFILEDGILFNKSKTALIRYPCHGKGGPYVIPDGVISIENSAFNGSGPASVTIPNSVTSIGDRVFESCGLTSVTIPNSVTSIGEYAFFRSSALKSVTIPNSVKTIGKSAFSDCNRLTSVTIPNSVKAIEERTFFECRGLTSVKIPNGVTSIGDGAFALCTSLTSIAIPNSVTSIEEGAFQFCYNLKSVKIGKGIKSIGRVAFSYCDEKMSVTIHNPMPPKFGKGAEHGDGDVFYATRGSLIYSLPVTIYVPARGFLFYRFAAGWNEIFRIWPILTAYEITALCILSALLLFARIRKSGKKKVK